MNTTQTPLITAFFKSPPHMRGKEGEREEEDVRKTNSCSFGPVSREEPLSGVLPVAPIVSRASSMGHEAVVSDGESSWCGWGGVGEGDVCGGDGLGRSAVNLCGLLGSQVGSRTSRDHMTPFSAPIPCSNRILENGTVTNDPLSTVGSGMRQGTLAWDMSSGKLTLKPMTSQSSVSPPLASGTGAESLVSDGVEEPPVCSSPVAAADEHTVDSTRHTTSTALSATPGPGVVKTQDDGGGGGVPSEAGRGALNGNRRGGRRACKKVDYSAAVDTDPADGSGEDFTEHSRRRQQRNGCQSTCAHNTRKSSGRRRRRKRSGRNHSVDEREFMVRVKRCHLYRVPGSEPDTDVEVTHCVEPADCVNGVDLDDSVVVVAATSPPRQPLALVKSASLPSPCAGSTATSSSLSGAWAKIFSHPARQKATGCKPAGGGDVTTSNTVSCSAAVSVSASPARSPKRRRRSASCSPQRRAVPRSPRAHRSPRKGSPLHSPRKGGSAPASPLKDSLKARKLLTFPPPLAKRRKVECDCAPFSGLVHVRQENSTEPLWTLTLGQPIFSVRNSATSLPGAQTVFSLKSCVEVAPPEQSGQPSGHSPLLPIAPDQRDGVLKLLTDTHPHVRVRHIFQRYCRIKEGGDPKYQAFTAHQQQENRIERRHRKPLVCSIHVLNHKNRALAVDVSAYAGKSGRRRSLRLTRKRRASLTSRSTPAELQARRKKRRMNTNSRSRAPDRLTEECAADDRERGERRESALVTDLWTEVYRPQSSSEVIGNKVGVQQMHGWLQTWKNKCSGIPNASDHASIKKIDRKGWRKKKRSDMNENQSRSSRENSPTPEWARREGGEDFLSLTHLRRRKRIVLGVCSSDSEEQEEGGCEGVEGEGVSSVLLLCGPEGSGKTAAVYACAAELGLKIFEVNSSSMRSRGSLLATLKEATLSHQVSMQPKAPQLLSSITSFFKQPLTESVRTAAGNQSACERKVSRRKREGLLSFFKPQSGRESKTVVRQKEMTTESAGVLSCERDHSSSMVSLETNTVILLEEVDILFDSDRGFWSGVYEVIETTRKPIILTCNDSRLSLDCEHVKIVFEPSSLVELGMHMQLLCLSHDCHMTSEAAVQLADSLHADIRRVFLSLQFWTAVTSHTPHPPTVTSHTPHPSTITTHATHPSLSHIAGLPAQHYRREAARGSTSLLPLALPWRPLQCDLHRPTAPSHEEMDMASHCAEQHSYVDTVAIDRRSCDHHMILFDDVFRPWWVCPEESSVLDELPVSECVWGEEEVNCALCEEVERGVGGVVRSEPHNNAEFSRHIGTVRQCLERCAELFGLHSSRVGVATDGLPLLRTICDSENHHEMSNAKRRFRHYLQSCVVDQLDLRTLPLATRFPSSQI